MSDVGVTAVSLRPCGRRCKDRLVEGGRQFGAVRPLWLLRWTWRRPQGRMGSKAVVLGVLVGPGRVVGWWVGGSEGCGVGCRT